MARAEMTQSGYVWTCGRCRRTGEVRIPGISGEALAVVVKKLHEGQACTDLVRGDGQSPLPGCEQNRTSP